MARKQNKSSKVTKKDSSICVNNKKSGKVQKKIPSSKAKKIVESKLKEAVKSKPNNNKSQVKHNSPVKVGRKSSRSNPEITKKSSPISSQRTVINKVSISTRASVSSKLTGKVQSASKKKSNPVNQPTNKKTTSPTKSLRLKKDETAGLKRGEIKMNLRGKKRSYAQMASGNESVIETASKKKKTAEPKNVTSRRSRSIKPTAKVAEWRSVILQKKSNTHQDKSNRKTEKPSSIKRFSGTANKSPKARTPKTQVSPAKKSVRQSEGRRSTVKVQNPPASKNKVKNAKNIHSTLQETPNARRNRNKKSLLTPQENKNKPNTLAASIKNKFNSCVTRKRKSNNAELEENVVVAQGILHDILYSVGNDDTSILNEEVDKESVDMKTVGVSDSQVPQLDIIDHDVLSENKQVSNVPSKKESNIGMNNGFTEKEKDIVNLDHKFNRHFSDDGGEISINKKCYNEEKESVENVSMEDMELHLSDTSSTCSNNDTLSSEISKSKSVLDPEQSCEISNVFDSSLNSENKLNDTKETEVELDNQITLSNNNDSSASTSFVSEAKKSSLLANTEPLQKKKNEIDLSSNELGSLSQSDVSSDILEDTKNSTSALTCTKPVVIGKGLKGLHEASTNTLEDCKKENEATEILNVIKDNSTKSSDIDIKTDSDKNLDEHKLCLTNGKSTVSNLLEVNSSPKKDNSIINCLDKSQTGKISLTEIESNELVNGEGKTNNGVLHRDDKIKSEGTLDLEKVQETNIVIGNENLENNMCLKSNSVKVKNDSNLEDPTSKCLSEDTETSVSESRHLTETNVGNSEDDELNNCKISDKPTILNKLPPSSFTSSSCVVEEKNTPKDSSDCKTVSEERRPLTCVMDISASTNLELDNPTLNAEINHCHPDSSDSSKLTCNETVVNEVSKKKSNDNQIVVKDELESGDSNQKISILESGSVKSTEEALDSTLSSNIENLKDNSMKTNLKDEKVYSDSSISSLRNEKMSVGEICSSKDSHSDSNLSSGNQLKNTEILNQTADILLNNSEVSATTNKDEEPIEGVSKMEEENQENIQDAIIVDETDGESMQCSSGTLSNRMSVDEESGGMEVDAEGLGTAGNACSSIEINMEVS